MTDDKKKGCVACVHVYCVDNILVNLANHVFERFVVKREQVVVPSLGYMTVHVLIGE